MLSPLKMRAQVIKYSTLSVLSPDYYFIQGYFMGLGTCPALIPASRWMPDLFGEVNFDDEQQLEYMGAVQQLYNTQMEKVMQAELKLPAKCVLSKTKFAASLATEQPLPQWCLGMLKALNFIDKRKLNKVQKKELKSLAELLQGFTSVNNAKKQFAIMSSNFEYHAHEFKRLLTTYINNTIYEMRFADGLVPQFTDSANEFEQSDESEMDAFDELMQVVMTEENAGIIEMLNEIIEHLEQTMGPQFIEQNSGHFWGLHETRNYMRCRSRRAQLNFMHGHLAAAISELQALLILNPFDNQANRYPLVNYLIIAKRWPELDKLFAEYEEESLFMLSGRTLSSYAQRADCAESNDLKQQLKKLNKHFETYITGQRKAPKEPPQFYQPGDKSEVFTYLDIAGKETWRSVDGALFWLRKK